MAAFSERPSARLLMASAARLRGQRISRRELVEEAQRTLRKAGVPNCERASFVNRLSKFVVGNSAPIFCQLQPKIRPRPSANWVRAYELVSSYVAAANLSLTLDTMNTELHETKQSLKVSIRSLQDINDELNDLLMSSDASRSTDDLLVRRMSRASETDLQELQVQSPGTDRLRLIGPEILIGTPDQIKKPFAKNLPPMGPPPPDDPSISHPLYPKPLSPKATGSSPWSRQGQKRPQ